MKYLTILAIVLLIRPAAAQTIVFTPQWSAQAQFAGYYVAQSEGYYKSEGLDVEISHASPSENAYTQLVGGKAQFVILSLSQALHYLSRGVDLVNVMQTSQVNSLLLVGHIPLPDIASLKNRKLGVYAYIDSDLVQFVAAKYKANPHLIRFNSGVTVFLSKAVDVCLMPSYNEFIQLAECGYSIDSTHMMRLSDWGYDMPEDGVYVLKTYYEQNKETVRKFVEASKKGWNYASTHEAETLEITMLQIEKNRVVTNKYHQQQMLREVLRLQKSPKTGERSYRLSEKSFQTALDFFSPIALKYGDFVK